MTSEEGRGRVPNLLSLTDDDIRASSNQAGQTPNRGASNPVAKSPTTGSRNSDIKIVLNEALPRPIALTSLPPTKKSVTESTLMQVPEGLENSETPFSPIPRCKRVQHRSRKYFLQYMERKRKVVATDIGKGNSPHQESNDDEEDYSKSNNNDASLEFGSFPSYTAADVTFFSNMSPRQFDLQLLELRRAVQQGERRASENYTALTAPTTEEMNENPSANVLTGTKPPTVSNKGKVDVSEGIEEEPVSDTPKARVFSTSDKIAVPVAERGAVLFNNVQGTVLPQNYTRRPFAGMGPPMAVLPLSYETKSKVTLKMDSESGATGGSVRLTEENAEHWRKVALLKRKSRNGDNANSPAGSNNLPSSTWHNGPDKHDRPFVWIKDNVVYNYSRGLSNGELVASPESVAWPVENNNEKGNTEAFEHVAVIANGFFNEDKRKRIIARLNERERMCTKEYGVSQPYSPNSQNIASGLPT